MLRAEHVVSHKFVTLHPYCPENVIYYLICLSQHVLKMNQSAHFQVQVSVLQGNTRCFRTYCFQDNVLKTRIPFILFDILLSFCALKMKEIDNSKELYKEYIFKYRFNILHYDKRVRKPH
jgi:hypothetical protein